MNSYEAITFGIVIWIVLGHLALILYPKSKFSSLSYDIESYQEVVIIVLLWPLVLGIEILNFIRERKNNA